jgi:hypothetical protein
MSTESRIKAVFFDRMSGRSWTWLLPDPPPPTVSVPDWDATMESQQIVRVDFQWLYTEVDVVDGWPVVVYSSIRGKRGDINERERNTTHRRDRLPFVPPESAAG